MAAFFICVALMAAGAHLDVPMTPTPMSMQSVAILLAGVVLGWRWGAVAVLAYLAIGGLGLPVFAGGASGWGHFMGPTAGYLVAFPLAAALAGVAAQRGLTRRWAPAMGVFLMGHVLLLSLGGAWLAVSIGPGPAWSGGVAPFLIGAVVKSALLAVFSVGWARRPGHLNI